MHTRDPFHVTALARKLKVQKTSRVGDGKLESQDGGDTTTTVSSTTTSSSRRLKI